MESDLAAQLLELGITGLFLAYLVWQNKQLLAKLDTWQEKYESLLEKLILEKDE